MIGGRHTDEVGLLAAIVPLRQRPSGLIACCRKGAAAFSWQRAISRVEANFDEDESRLWEACMSELGIVLAVGEEAIVHPGDRIRVASRSPFGHYRVPAYLRGKAGTVETQRRPALLRQTTSQ
jgi:hypothetical protein